MGYNYRDIPQIVREILAAKAEDGGVKNIYFVGCGGSLGALYPAKVFVERESLGLKTGWTNSNEFVHSTPRDFGKNSVLCVACHAGNTPETVAAAKLGKESGAAVVLLTYQEESEISAFADYLLLYSFDSSSSAHTGDMDYAGEKTQCALQLAVELVNDTEGYAHYDAFYQGVERIGGIIRKAREQVADRAKAFAQEYKNDSFLYTMGSGASWASAYMESICIFMEMQWIHSACIHTGEYFHGPFEVTDCNAGFVVQIAEGSGRELDERCLRFLKKYAKRFEVLDAKELGLSTIDPSVVDYFNHSLFNNVYPIYNAALAEARQHPLSTRRYMWKVAY